MAKLIFLKIGADPGLTALKTPFSTASGPILG